MWKQGVWLGRDGADQDVIATTPQTITKTRSVRKTAHEWVAKDILAIEIGPWNTSSRLESKLRVQPLRGLLPRHIPDADRDLDADAVQASPIQLLRQSFRKARALATKVNLTAHHHLAVKAGGKNKVRLTFLKNKVGKLQVHSLLVHQQYLWPHKLQTQWALMLNPLEVQNTGARKQHSKERERQLGLMRQNSKDHCASP